MIPCEALNYNKTNLIPTLKSTPPSFPLLPPLDPLSLNHHSSSILKYRMDKACRKSRDTFGRHILRRLLHWPFALYHGPSGEHVFVSFLRRRHHHHRCGSLPVFGCKQQPQPQQQRQLCNFRSGIQVRGSNGVEETSLNFNISSH